MTKVSIPYHRRTCRLPLAPPPAPLRRRIFCTRLARIGTMTILRSLLLIVLIAPVAPAQAVEVLFPTGSRVGLAPPPGMTPSRSFAGFEDAANQVAVVIASLPAEAYAELERSTNAAALKQRGLIVEKRESQSAAAGKGFLVIARQQVDNVKLRKWIFAVAAADLTALVTIQVPDAASAAYPESAIRAALSTTMVRDVVPVEEQLSLLPFRV